jgi:hypothetical protein
VPSTRAHAFALDPARPPFKDYPVHNTAHVWALPLDALAAVRAAYPFSVADVERMEVTFPQNWTAIMDDPSGATYAPVNYAQA